MEPHIVWPTPGLPALLAAGMQRIGIVVATAATALDPLAAWAQDLGVRSGRDFGPLAVHIEQIESIAPHDVPLVRDFAQLPNTAALHYARLTVRLPNTTGPLPPRSVRVLDIVRGGRVLRRNAIGVFAPGRRLTLAFASDVHVAAVWDTLHQAVDQHAPDLAPDFLHPSALLARFVDEANALASRGELDLVVFGGDLIDHVYEAPREPGRRRDGRTNYDRFLDIVGALRVPMLTLPGNHDHRLYPWRPRLHGLTEVGLPAHRVRPLLRRARLWDPWPLRASDRDLLRTQDADGTPALAHYLTHLAPATDFALSLRGLRLVFASTGRDVLPRWRHVERRRRGLLVRSLPTSRHDPDCEGLRSEQIVHVATSLREGHTGAALFMHAPLLHDRGGPALEQNLRHLDPGDRDDDHADLAFEHQLFATGLRCGVAFRNPAALVRVLAAAPGSLVVFAGHVHHGSGIAFDPLTLRVRRVPLAAPRTTQRTVTLLTAPALGHRRPEDGADPGYLLARFDDGSPTAIAQCTLGLSSARQ
jgi:calcineurin-like phosphoesterase family protein